MGDVLEKTEQTVTLNRAFLDTLLAEVDTMVAYSRKMERQRDNALWRLEIMRKERRDQVSF